MPARRGGPHALAARPRATVSTSGSSGMAGVLALPGCVLYVAAHGGSGDKRRGRFRLSPRRGRGKGAAGAPRLRQRRRALRPDERSDERRHPSRCGRRRSSTGSTRGRASACVDVAGGTGDIALRFLAAPARQRARSSATSTRRCCAPAATAPSTAAASTASTGSCGDAERAAVRERRSVDAYTIAFGLRNVTRDRGGARRGAARAASRAGASSASNSAASCCRSLARAYDLYSFAVLPRLGQIVDRRPRRLSISGREHPPLPAAGRARRA